MKGLKRKPTPGSEPPAADAPELPERWSAPRKTELVLRLLRGEALDAVSRESQVPAHELETWKRVLPGAGHARLADSRRTRGTRAELARAQIGEPMMRLERWPRTCSENPAPIRAPLLGRGFEHHAKALAFK
jgi:hypothetical protein